MRFRIFSITFVVTIIAVAAGLSPATGADPAVKSNVLLIMADDMGYSDLGCYGSSIDTPNLNRLAANGLRFTNFYNEGRCWPTRAAKIAGTDRRGATRKNESR